MNVKLSNISFTYPGGSQALRDVSLDIEAGEAVAIVGQNGAGKTTLVKHLNGLLKPDQGEVMIGDWNTRDHSVAQMAARVGYVFQNPDDQIVERTVRNEVAFGPRKLGQSETEITANVAAALELVNLSAEADTHPYDLTLAQRKMVTLASVLAMRTPVVVFDEPTMAQDAVGVRLIGEIVERLKDEGRTTLIITHDIDFCAVHFERVVVMGNGRIMTDGLALEVLNRTELLAQTNVEPPQMVRLGQALSMSPAPLQIDEFVAALGKRS